MSTLKTVFNKLTKEDKVELKSEKIELANIKDFKAKNKTFEKSIQNFTTDIVDIVNAREAARKKYTNLANDFSVLDKEYQGLRKAVMDLGVNMPEKIESTYKIALRLMESSNKDYKELVK